MDEILPAETDFEEIAPPEPSPEQVKAESEKDEPFFRTEMGILVKKLVDALDDQQEKSARELMVRVWKKYENYWRDRHYIIWDEFSADWRTPEELMALDPTLDVDPAAYAKVVNIYKAHGEAIISALSSGLPHVNFLPDDADSQDDIFTAKSYTKISHLIQKRNKGQLLFIRALFLLYNCGVVFAYNENKLTTKYGTTKRGLYADVEITHRQYFCPACGFMLGSEQREKAEEGAETVQGTNNFEQPMEVDCPQCGQTVFPDYEDYDDVINRLTGYTDEPKATECIEIFGPLQVKVPLWVRTLQQTPKIELESEEDIALLQNIFSEIAEFIAPSSDLERYDRYGRNNSDYRGDTPMNLATFRRIWIAPWAYNRLGLPGSEEDIALLKKTYPQGMYVAMINDVVAEAVDENMHDRWTATQNPLSNHLHADPLGQSLIPIQDITNELTNLTLETIEFGIPETFYDPEAIDREAYSKSEARPGMMYPAKPRTQMGLDSSFHTVKTSTLSQEVGPFAEKIEQYGQLVVGAQPTIWGGALEGSGGTAREVEQSKASALQRLNLTWILTKVWWSEVMAKSVTSFAKNMTSDERYVEKKGNSFVNVWIRRTEMEGKVGQVEPEINEAFPVSWTQKRDILLNLISLKNPMSDAVISHPENSSTVAAAIGFPELYIPGDDSRNKQLWEISQLIMSEPMPTGMPNPTDPMQEAMMPSIMVEKWEDHIVEGETCRAWLISEVGIDCKQNNPAAYMNVVAHMTMHDQQAQAMAAQQAAMQGEENEKAGQDAPPSGE